MSIYVGTSEIKNVYIGTTPVKEVYVGTTKVRPETWKPGSNTIAYRPLNGNYNDIVGGKNGTATSGMGFVTLGDRQVAQVNSNKSGISIPGTVMNGIGTGDFTLSFWSKLVSKHGTYENMIMGIYSNTDPRPGVGAWIQANGIIGFQCGNSLLNGPSASTLYGSWHHFCQARRSGVIYCYIDGESQGYYTYNTALNFDVGYIVSRDHNNQYMAVGTQGAEYIIERVGWNTAEVKSYYNHNKI